MKKLFCISTVLSASAASLCATPITGGLTGLTGSFSTINFDAGTVAPNGAVTTQFAGATFGNFVWAETDSNGQGGSTGFSGGNLMYGSLEPSTIVFNSTVSAGAFAIVDLGGLVTFNARLGGVSGTIVETFNLTIPFNPGAGFVGFQGISFDTIEIVHSTSAIAIDTLQFKSIASVPDANSTLLLLSAALVSLGLARRKIS